MANNVIAYIEKTMPRVVDKVLAQSSLTDSLIGGNEIKLDFLDAKTVKITKMSTTGLTTYARGGHGGTNGTGAVQSTQETFTLSQERYSAIPLDKLDTLDDAETVFGKLAKQFAETKVVQEFDAYRFSQLAAKTNVHLGNRVNVAPASLDNHIIDEFNKALKWFADAKVPENEIVIYVSPEVMYKIRSTTELYKKLSQSEYAGKVTFAIQNYENKPIVEVPSDEFYTDIMIGDGYYPSATSKKIHFMMVWKKAPIIVKKLDWTHIYDSETTKLNFVGYSFENLFYHDLFVTDNMTVGIYACVSTESAQGDASVLRAALKAAGNGTQSVIDGIVVTQPMGIIWDKIGLHTTDATAPAIGASYTGADVAEVSATGEVNYKNFTPGTSHNILVASFDGKVVATSKDFGATANMPK